MSEQKYKALEDYLHYFFSHFTKDQKIKWVEENIDLLEELEKTEEKLKKSNDSI